MGPAILPLSFAVRTPGAGHCDFLPSIYTQCTAGVRPAGKATVWRIAGDDPKAFNTVDQQPIAVKESKIDFGDTLRLPPYSVSLYRLPLAR